MKQVYRKKIRELLLGSNGNRVRELRLGSAGTGSCSAGLDPAASGTWRGGGLDPAASGTWRDRAVDPAAPGTWRGGAVDPASSGTGTSSGAVDPASSGTGTWSCCVDPAVMTGSKTWSCCVDPAATTRSRTQSCCVDQAAMTGSWALHRFGDPQKPDGFPRTHWQGPLDPEPLKVAGPRQQQEQALGAPAASPRQRQEQEHEPQVEDQGWYDSSSGKKNTMWASSRSVFQYTAKASKKLGSSKKKLLGYTKILPGKGKGSNCWVHTGQVVLSRFRR